MFSGGVQTFKVNGKDVERDVFDASLCHAYFCATKFIGAFGEYLINEKIAHINGVNIDVPDDVIARGSRLAHKHGLFYSPYEYVIEWAAYKLGKN